MTVGSTYPNMSEFKLALCQHAIKHKFEFRTMHSSKRRFRGYCARKMEDKCPWKIHASTTVDQVTVVVTGPSDCRGNYCCYYGLLFLIFVYVAAH